MSQLRRDEPQQIRDVMTPNPITLSESENVQTAALAMSRTEMRPTAVLGLSFVAGSIPSSNITARLRAAVDLRDVGTGTVSGTALYRVAGFGPLAVAGIVDIAKAVVGPLLAGRARP